MKIYVSIYLQSVFSIRLAYNLYEVIWQYYEALWENSLNISGARTLWMLILSYTVSFLMLCNNLNVLKENNHLFFLQICVQVGSSGSGSLNGLQSVGSLQGFFTHIYLLPEQGRSEEPKFYGHLCLPLG